jgi:hypothetical protein
VLLIEVGHLRTTQSKTFPCHSLIIIIMDVPAAMLLRSVGLLTIVFLCASLLWQSVIMTAPSDYQDDILHIPPVNHKGRPSFSDSRLGRVSQDLAELSTTQTSVAAVTPANSTIPIRTPVVGDKKAVVVPANSASTTSNISAVAAPTRRCPYRGILWIRQGDESGATGAIFFLFVLNQLMYAEKYHLLPIVHLNEYSRWVYDPVVHGGNAEGGNSSNAVVRSAIPPTRQVLCANKRRIFRYPGPPDYEYQPGSTLTQDEKSAPPCESISQDAANSTVNQSTLVRRHVKQDDHRGNFILTGTGVWSTYFLPVSPVTTAHLLRDPTTKSTTSATVPNKAAETCELAQLPLVTLAPSDIIPGLHSVAPWATRAWPYGGLPKTADTAYRRTKSVEQWLYSHRQAGAQIVSKYYRPQPWLQEQVDRVMQQRPALPSQQPGSPTPDNSVATRDDFSCLGLHVRHSDKGNTRRHIGLAEFLLYARAYIAEIPHGVIYLATDSQSVVAEVRSQWIRTNNTDNTNSSDAPFLSESQVLVQSDIIRSTNATAVFKIVGAAHHRSNSEVLIDILALSQCQFFVHGLSAVSEAVHYWNPSIHVKNRSVNLEEARPEYIIPVESFAERVREFAKASSPQSAKS